MIRSDEELAVSRKLLEERQRGLALQREALETMGASEAEIENALAPLASFVAGIEEEIRAYEQEAAP